MHLNTSSKKMCGIQFKQHTPNKIRQSIQSYISRQLRHPEQADFFYKCQENESSFICIYCQEPTSTFIVQDIFSHTQKWEINYICLKHFCYDNLIKAVCHINFSTLLILQLDQCILDNIQPLAWLNMQQVKRISLEENSITNYKPLQKSLFKFLQNFSVINNFATLHQIRYFNSLFFVAKPNQTKELQKNSKQFGGKQKVSLRYNIEKNYNVKIKMQLSGQVMNEAEQRNLLYIKGNYFQSNFKYIFVSNSV